MATKFNVAMNTDDMEGKTVLVFIRPTPALSNYRIHAWQVLTASAGSIESFSYDSIITTNVSSVGVNPDNQLVSETKYIQPGSLLQAVSPNGLSPKLQEAPTSAAQEKLTPSQVGVINNTEPYIQFDCNWLVNHKPVATVQDVDARMTCSFEYKPIFYFMVAAPPMVGQTFIAQNFSGMTSYVMPITATEIDVSVTKVQGRWAFNFSEKFK